LGIIDEVCMHMTTPPIHNKKWTQETIQEIIALCETKQEFRARFPGAYSASWKLGILQEVTSHFPSRNAPNKKWTPELISIEMIKYNSRTEFQKGSPGAYDAAQSSGILEQLYDGVNLKIMHGTSLAEQEIFRYVESLGLYVEKYYFEKPNGDGRRMEIDVYVPSLKIGIEHCGLHWHSELFKSPDYHLDKLNASNRDGIRLITIFEDEWLSRKEQVKNFLKSILVLATTKIPARKCKVEIIDVEIAKRFIDLNHIQGRVLFNIAWGLYFNDELVGVMTAGRHHRGKKDCLVLSRMCFKDGYSIVGGASKLFNSLKKYAINNKYSSIVSWSDNRWSEGNVYKKMGFGLEQELSPDYSYTKGKVLKRYSKQSMKKNFKKDDMSKTERELRLEQGYSRIWDCGKKRWIYNLS